MTHVEATPEASAVRAAKIKERLVFILGQKSFDRIEKTYLSVFDAKYIDTKYDIVVFVARRAFAIFNAFRSYLEIEHKDVSFSNSTTDDMIDSWLLLNKSKNIQRMCIIDDTYLYGSHLRNLVKTLRKKTKLRHTAIDIRVLFARELSDSNPKDALLKKKDSRVFGENAYEAFFKDHEGYRYPKKEVQRKSWDIVTAVHATSTPYVSYIPAFKLTLDELRQKLFKDAQTLEPGEEILQENLSDSFRNWKFENITIQPTYDVNVEAFCLFPPTEAENDIMRRNVNYKDIDEVSSIRIYINHELEDVLIVPYIAFCAVSSNKKLIKILPDEISSLCDNLASAHKLIKYTASYLYGKNFLQEKLGIEHPINYLTSHAGLQRDSKFMSYIDKEDLKELDNVWAYFKNNKTKTRNTLSSCFPFGFQAKLIKKLKSILADSIKYYGDYGLLAYVMQAFDKLTDTMDMYKDRRFKGISSESLRGLINQAIKPEKDKEVTDTQYAKLIFKLCDWGGGVTRVVQNRRFIGVARTAVFTGELVCCATNLTHSCLTYAMSELDDGDQAYKKIFRDYVEIKIQQDGDDDQIARDYLDKGDAVPPAKLETIHPFDPHWFYIDLMRWIKRFKEIENSSSGSSDPDPIKTRLQKYVLKRLNKDGVMPNSAAQFILDN
jgi:hypothetical protein